MEFDGTDRPADMIDSLFDDTDPVLFEVDHGLRSQLYGSVCW